MVNSKKKGKDGELEIAALLRHYGYHDARRGQQFRGGGDSPDVVGLPGFHLEVKRTERLRVCEAVDQARRDAAKGAIPVVVYRGNNDKLKSTSRGEWLFILGAKDFFDLLDLAGYGPRTLEDMLGGGVL